MDIDLDSLSPTNRLAVQRLMRDHKTANEQLAVAQTKIATLGRDVARAGVTAHYVRAGLDPSNASILGDLAVHRAVKSFRADGAPLGDFDVELDAAGIARAFEETSPDVVRGFRGAAGSGTDTGRGDASKRSAGLELVGPNAGRILEAGISELTVPPNHFGD
jgi:hypothetical protein